MKANQSNIIKIVKAALSPKFTKPNTPSKEILKECGIDANDIEWRFRSLRITLRDAFIEYGDRTLRVAHLFDLSTQTSRRKLKKSKYAFTREFKDDPKIPEQWIQRNELLDLLKKLDVRAEAALGGTVICKQPLLAVIKYFDGQLISKRKDLDMHYPFTTIVQRADVITEWVNWFFKTKYGIESKYKPEQIRKLIDGTYEKKATQGTVDLPN